MRIHLTTSVLVAAALALSGCASSSQGSTADPAARATHSSATTGTAAGSSETEPAVPTTLPRQRLCGALDPRSAARALGLPPASFKLGSDLAPGQKYAPFPGQPKVASTGWRCTYGSSFKPGGEGGFVGLLMQDDPATSSSVKKSAALTRDAMSMGKKARCTLEPAKAWGPVGSALLCTRPEMKGGGTYQTGYSQLTYRGLFGDVDFRCIVELDPVVDADRVRAAADQICPTALAALAH